MSVRVDDLHSLRVRAERALGSPDRARSARPEALRVEAEPLERVVEELRIYQVELELQNEELRSAQGRVERAYEQYSRLWRGMPVPAMVMNTKGVIAEGNTQAAEFFGFRSVAQMAGHSALRLLDAASRTVFFAALSSATGAVPSQIAGMTIPSADGARRSFDVFFIEVETAHSVEPSVMALFVDRSAEQAREQERQLFQSLLDNSSALMFAFDAEGRCLLANAALQRALRRSREAVVGCPREAWLTPADAEAQRADDLLVLRGGRAHLTEETMCGPDSEVRRIATQKFPLRGADGAIFGVGGIATDITDLRKIEARLHLAMQAFNQGSEGILITDARNRIISANAAFLQMCGYAERELLGHNPSFLSSGRHDAGFYGAMWQELLQTNRWEGEICNRRKDGALHPQWLTISRVADERGATTNFVGVLTDLSRRKLAEAEIERLAFYDVLTGLPNRHLLRDRIAQAIRAAERNRGTFVLYFLDVDHFKEVNDTLGHDMGDQLLVEMGRRLRDAVRSEDTVSRWGGDEFVVLLVNADHGAAELRARAIIEACARPVLIEGKSVVVSASVGIAIYPDDGADANGLLQAADTAMYQAKGDGRNGWRMFNVAMAQRLARRSAVGAALRHALERDELWLAFQPQLDLTTGALCGVEALLRWRSAALGSPTPDEFIPVAEENGLIVAIGAWVLREALRHARRWCDAGVAPFRMAVNVSALQLAHPDCCAVVTAALEEAGWPADWLELEITERSALKNSKGGLEAVQRLRALGVHFAVDDFGTGYSSLSYLLDLPVDTVKIDRSFVTNLESDRRDEALVRAILALTRSLDFRCIAEGVETPGQIEMLRSAGCTMVQGFGLARPMPGSQLLDWWRSNVPLANGVASSVRRAS